jgi:hypothetical protein
MPFKNKIWTGIAYMGVFLLLLVNLFIGFAVINAIIDKSIYKVSIAFFSGGLFIATFIGYRNFYKRGNMPK